MFDIYSKNITILVIYVLLITFNTNIKTHYKKKIYEFCKKRLWHLNYHNNMATHFKTISNFRKQQNSPTFVCIRHIIDLLEYTRVVGYWWRYRLFTSLIFIFAIEESSKNSLMFFYFTTPTKFMLTEDAWMSEILSWFDSIAKTICWIIPNASRNTTNNCHY